MSAPAHIGRIVNIIEKGGVTYVCLDTGFIAGTRETHIISDAVEAREMGAVVDLETLAPSDPSSVERSKYRPTLLAVVRTVMSAQEQNLGVVSAFPHHHGNGMTLRDYFAATVLPAAMQNFYVAGPTWDGFGDVAEHCYKVADAMLAERGQP